MTDRFVGLTVTLDRDMREDDAESIIAAISLIKGVAKVTPHVSDIRAQMAIERAKNELRHKILALIE